MSNHIEYKYNILYRLQRMPYDEYKLALKFFPQWLGVSFNTFKNWIYIKENNHFDIPANCLLKLAQFFEVEPKQMYCKEPEHDGLKEWKAYKLEHQPNMFNLN